MVMKSAVTPADLIYGHKIAETQQYEIVSSVLSTFINQWKKDYLLSLRDYSTNI